MRQSHLFTKTTKEAPKGEKSFNAQILMRAGFIDKLSAGVYSYLPLGLRVHDNICQIIREEMNNIGGQEILMPSLTKKEIWQKTGRWDSFDVLFKLTGANKKDYALGATHEEVVTPIMSKYIFSHKELPAYVYQIQTKFRNELRAKAGLLRGREFSMKDLYSFNRDQEEQESFYQKTITAYFEVFKRCGLGEITYLTYASGGDFSKYSHEFQTESENGEDLIYLCQDCKVAVNREIIEEQSACPLCEKENLKEVKAIEVGNIFKLGTRFSKAFGLYYTDDKGEKRDVEMGCYGIGPSRLMGTIVEILNDKKGVIWPEEVAPFKIHLISLDIKNETISKKSEELYKEFSEKGIEVLFDDRNLSAGEKFAEADLIGIPYRLVVSERTLAENAVELKKRDSEEIEMIKAEEIADRLS